MTHPEIERQRQIDLHSGNLRDIKALRESSAFNGYWLRKLNEKRAAADQSYHGQPASESTRQVIAAYDDLLVMMKNDEKQSTGALEQLVGPV